LPESYSQKGNFTLRNIRGRFSPKIYLFEQNFMSDEIGLFLRKIYSGKTNSENFIGLSFRIKSEVFSLDAKISDRHRLKPAGLFKK